MPKIYHLGCPNCGGLLASRGERLIQCKYCGTKNLVKIPDYLPKRYLKPQINAQTARRTMVNLFKMPEVETGIIRQARFESGELFFIPFYLVNARRIGIITSKILPEKKKIRKYEYDPATGMMKIQTRYTPKPGEDGKERNDSRVIMNDLIRSFPALNLENWGINQLKPEETINQLDLALLPYQRQQIDKYGIALEPRISLEQRLESLFKSTELAFLQDQTEIAEQRVILLYYPVWRIRWRYQGKIYYTSIDAISGEIIYARAPARSGARVLWLILIASALGFSIGKLIKVPYLILATGEIGIGLLLLFILGLLFFVAFGWNMVRYSSELVIQGEDKHLEWVARPKETFFDRLALGMSKFLEGLLKQSLESRRYNRW